MLSAPYGCPPSLTKYITQRSLSSYGYLLLFPHITKQSLSLDGCPSLTTYHTAIIALPWLSFFSYHISHSDHCPPMVVLLLLPHITQRSLPSYGCPSSLITYHTTSIVFLWLSFFSVRIAHNDIMINISCAICVLLAIPMRCDLYAISWGNTKTRKPESVGPRRIPLRLSLWGLDWGWSPWILMNTSKHSLQVPGWGM